MKKIYTQQNTGVIAGIEKEAEFFEIEGVYLRINYATSEQDLKEGKVPFQRDVKIDISDDLLQKLLSVHSEAKEVKDK